MTTHALANWHRLVEDRNVAGLDALLSDRVVFYSPIVFTPQLGKAATAKFLTAAFHVLVNDSFRYLREVADDRGAVLEFQVEIEGVVVNGVDMIQWDDAGKIVEFKVMLRPLKAIQLIHQKMAALLQAST